MPAANREIHENREKRWLQSGFVEFVDFAAGRVVVG